MYMYTQNKVSTLLPLVLITSFCVGTSTPSLTYMSTVVQIETHLQPHSSFQTIAGAHTESDNDDWGISVGHQLFP
jgi:hypothetical protein